MLYGTVIIIFEILLYCSAQAWNWLHNLQIPAQNASGEFQVQKLLRIYMHVTARSF